MKGYDAKFLDELKSKNSLEEVVSQYIPLEQRGTNFWGRCPFHHEKTASFCVNSLDQFYYCFGCHKSGDVISFIQEIESLDFAEAVKFLATRAKMPLPDIDANDDKIRADKQKKETLLNILRASAHFYVENLSDERAGKHLDYIASRNLTSKDIRYFGLGASLDFEGLPKYLSKNGYNFRDMVEAGVVGEHHHHETKSYGYDDEGFFCHEFPDETEERRDEIDAEDEPNYQEKREFQQAHQQFHAVEGVAHR